MEKTDIQTSNTTSVLFDGDLKHALNAIPQAIFVKDEQHRSYFLNDAARTLFDDLGCRDYKFMTAGRSAEISAMCGPWGGTVPSETLEEAWLTRLHPDDLVRVRRNWSRWRESWKPIDIEFRLMSPEGSYCWFRARATAHRAENGPVLRWYGTFENIDGQRNTIVALKESEARFRAIADNAPVMIWVTNETGEDDYHSRLWLETTGQTAEQSAGRGWLRAIHPDDRKRVEAGFNRAFSRRTPIRTEYRLQRAQGGSTWVIDVGQPRFATDGKFLGFVGIALDITERRNAAQERLLAKKQIHHMARHDALTGLPNRQFLLEEFLLLSDEIAPGTQVAVLCLDLVGFKAINEVYGRASGDVLLRRAAGRLRNSLLQSDILCRLGGDEFAILRIGVRSTDEASKLAERLIASVEEPYELSGTHVDLGITVGFAVALNGDQSLDELIQAADIALDQARVGGRGTYVQYEPGMDAQFRAKQDLKVALRHALGRNELQIHYQPLVNLHTGRITTFEALVRWFHPERGSVSPASFIPVAEETGLIGALGEWILRQACTEAAKWPPEISVAVNLSPLQFRNQDLVATVSTILNDSGLDAARLQLEITESVLLNECEGNLQTLKEIRQLGVKVAIDDFGTGYSSLGYLRTFRFDKIKVDRSFVADLPGSNECLAILKAVAAIGRSLGIVTTVEGVENQNQLELVKAEGFDEAQGYLIARPLPASQALGLL
uniref:putative bifunctional diguanylate cyclase/phosphodiesterase n=1 Tax=Ensifer adhaerens TaxID=106592 RepID=UPI003F4943C4